MNVTIRAIKTDIKIIGTVMSNKITSLDGYPAKPIYHKVEITYN